MLSACMFSTWHRYGSVVGDLNSPVLRRTIFFGPRMEESMNVIWVLETCCVGPTLDQLVLLS